VTIPDASILAAATRLAREEPAPGAADYDRDGKNPVDSWRALARAGFLGATIPRAHGGLGLGKSALGLTEAMFRVSAGRQAG
jgi:alkylation response protein AidB-like acyl-CoA dehydrogenase